LKIVAGSLIRTLDKVIVLFELQERVPDAGAMMPADVMLSCRAPATAAKLEAALVAALTTSVASFNPGPP
jgi:hypothetical protein